MFAALRQPAISNSVLNELATSGFFPDPALFVYGVLAVLVVTSLASAYLIFGRSDSWRTQEDSNLQPPAP